MKNRVIERIVWIFLILLIGGGSFYVGHSYSMNSGHYALNQVIDYIIENNYQDVTEEELYLGAIDGAIDVLDDPYTSYFDYQEAMSYYNGHEESYVGIGVSVTMNDDYYIIDTVVADGPADNAGLLPGDMIYSVNDDTMDDVSAFELVRNISGEKGTTVTIGIIRYGIDDVIVSEITRDKIDNPTVRYEVYEDTIGYIQVTTFGNETAQLFKAAILDLEENNNITGLIIDVRDNGGGNLTTLVNMLENFLTDELPLITTVSYVNNQETTYSYYSDNTQKKTYDIVVLTNEYSASASEAFAAAMKENGGYDIVGKSTYGKGTMQSDFSIYSRSDDVFHLTIGKWYTPLHNWVNSNGGTDGVSPTAEVEMNKGFNAYKIYLIDEVLEYDTVTTANKNLQVILSALGYDVRLDGYYDNDTKTAVMDIQTNNGIDVTGIVDSETAVIINQLLDEYQDNYLNDKQLGYALELFDD